MRHLNILRYASILIFGYLLLLSLSYSHGASAYQPLFTIVVGISIWAGTKFILLLDGKFGNTRILLGILFVGCVIRFLWAYLIPTLPFSDFKVFFHEVALNLAQGSAVLNKNMGYSLLLSAGYRLYPSVLTGKLINAIASTLSILFIYLLGLKIVDQKTGLLAAFLFSLLPNEIVMVSVLGTEIVSTTIGVITAFCITHATIQKDAFRLSSILLAGLFYGLGLAVRSSYIFYAPAIIILFVVVSFDFRRIWKLVGCFCAGVALGLFLFLAGYFLSTKQFSTKPLKTQDSFPLLSGTNFATSGTWSQEDWDLYLSWPVEKRNVMARSEAIGRIKSNPIEFVKIIPQKMAILMSSNDYGNLWSLRRVNLGKGNLLIGLISQSYYVVILLFAFSSSRDFDLLSAVVFVLVVFTLLPHIFFEVQGRYHHYIMPFLVLLASNGMQKPVSGV